MRSIYPWNRHGPVTDTADVAYGCHSPQSQTAGRYGRPGEGAGECRGVRRALYGGGDGASGDDDDDGNG